VHTEEPALTRLRVVRWMMLLTPLMLAWFVWAAAIAAPGFGLTGRRLVVVLSAAAFVAGVFGRNATAASPGRAAHVVFVGAMLVSSVTLVVTQPGGPGSVGVLVAVLCAATGLMAVRVAVPVLIAAFVVLEMAASITGQDPGFLAAIAGFAVLFGSMYLAFRLAEAQRETRRLLAEREAGEAALAEAAVLAERQRLAREMHDVLAHSLSGLSLQLEGARMLVARDPADPRLAVAIDRAHHLARSGLEEARRAIGLLRDDDLPGPDRLAGLAEQFTRDQDVPCEFATSGEPHPLGSQARLAIYRVAQEALTNVTRHASPDPRLAPPRLRTHRHPPGRRGLRRRAAGDSRRDGRLRAERDAGTRRAAGRDPQRGRDRPRLPGRAGGAGMIRVLIADDQRVVREGLSMVLGLMEGVEVVGTATDGAEAVTLVRAVRPDVVLMDLRMPRCDGVEATRRLRTEAPEVKVVVLTTYSDDRSVLDAVRAGARGYLTKDAGGEQIHEALRQVVDDHAVIDPAVQRHLVDAIAGEPPPRTVLPGGLTPREAEVLSLMAGGLSNAEIAARLTVSEATVKSHVNHLFAKIGARDRAQAVAYAFRHDLSEP